MKLQPDRMDTLAVTSYGPDWIAVNGERHQHSLLITSQGILRPWRPTHFESLQATDFEVLMELGVELAVFGSGKRLRFIPAAWQAPLMARRLGLETMDTAAACRTYNILAGEGRPVAALLLLETAPAPETST
ncbi:MAG: hypothetical protein FGM44_03195 [Limnohabitans sp.]|jgi:uncharacterized protein|nr:hypothetical protein [Limnohabitans sp.]